MVHTDRHVYRSVHRMTQIHVQIGTGVNMVYHIQGTRIAQISRDGIPRIDGTPDSTALGGSTGIPTHWIRYIIVRWMAHTIQHADWYTGYGTGYSCRLTAHRSTHPLQYTRYRWLVHHILHVQTTHRIGTHSWHTGYWTLRMAVISLHRAQNSCGMRDWDIQGLRFGVHLATPTPLF